MAYALQVWAYECILVATHICAKKSEEPVFPRITRWDVVSTRIMSSAVHVVLCQNDELHARMMKHTSEELHKDYTADLDSNFSQFDGPSSFVGEGVAQECPKESFALFSIGIC